ncbi:hypothetical protein A2U01_0050001, partial [Trifolium medium]|nr:hypothetical protein [Trifolium medium]
LTKLDGCDYNWTTLSSGKHIGEDPFA